MKYILFLLYSSDSGNSVRAESVEFETKESATKAGETLCPKLNPQEIRRGRGNTRPIKWYVLPKGNPSAESIYLDLVKSHPLGNPEELKKQAVAFWEVLNNGIK